MTLKELHEDLKSDRIKSVILDTDTYNEVDDQFALSYALMRDDKIKLLSVNAAPFFNDRSESPKDGMIKSFDEIKHILSFFSNTKDLPVFHGSEEYLSSKTCPVESDACDNIINSVLTNKGEPVYIIAIGAITNVASAIIKCPEIVEKSALIWLGGHARTFVNTMEFNLYQDVLAAQVVFESGIPMLQLPCMGVVSEFVASLREMKEGIGGSNELSDYLVNIVHEYNCPNLDDRKVLWDVTAIAGITDNELLNIVELPSKSVTMDGLYSEENLDHNILYVDKIKTDELYRQLFCTLSNGKFLK